MSEKDPKMDLATPTVAMGVVPTKDQEKDHAHHEHDDEASRGASGCAQVWALMEKNALSKVRTPGATFAELLSPVLLMMVLWISYNMSEILVFPSKYYHALNVDLPLFWDTGIYAAEEEEDFDLSDTHRRRLGADDVKTEPAAEAGVDFGLNDHGGDEEEDDETSLWTWAHLLQGQALEDHEPEEEFGLVNDLLMMNLFRQGQRRRDLGEMMEESIFEDDEVLDFDAREQEQEESSGDWMEEILTDIKQETVDKVDWEQVVQEIKDNFGEMWGEAGDYITLSSRGSARRTLNSLRLRLKDLLRRPIVVPTFSQYVWASKMLSGFFNIRRNLPRALEDSSYGRQWGNLLTLGTIHLAPRQHPMTQKFINYLEQAYPLAASQVVIRVHEDHDQAMEYVMGHLDEERTWAVIDLSDLQDGSSSSSKGGSFMIRMNHTTVPNTALVENYVASGLSTKYQRYFLSGYLTLQRTINDFVISESGCEAENIDPFFTMPMPTAAYEQNVFFLHVGYLLGLVLVMAFLYPTSRLIQSLVEERETRMKETLLILGVRPWAHTTSWVLTSMLTFVFITCFMTVALQYILTHTSFALIWFWLAVFGMASMSFCFFLASFFSKAKLAAVIGPMALFASLLPRFVFFGTNRYEATGAKFVASILPGTALAFGADIVGDYEYGEQSVGNNFWVGDYSFGMSIFFLIFDTIFYMVLAWYTEQVIPREYGAAPKPWYFPFVWCFPRSLFSRCHSTEKTLAGDDDDSDDDLSLAASVDKTSKARQTDDCVEPVTDPALIPRVFINDLVKRYNNKAPKPAINHLNLTLYESQITGLLGHNGAGKTSTVSILTGLFPPTSGGVTIYGHSITEDMAKARQSIGICPQHDVLFDRLTVMEHLRFFSKIKGVSFDDRDLRERALELGLTEDQLRTTAAALSGGNKRKLSVAIALCGDPKFLILDEPTSAMDPTARRRCWQVLRKKREGRVTLLTTHFMDEAEHLSDRVAVVKEGELQCCGSPLYLKDKYNLGWNLTVVMEKPEDAEGVENEYAGCQLRITSFLQQYIPQTELVRRSGRELTFCFPKGSEDMFPEAFDAFEQQSKDLGVSSYGIENASFEEVFLLLAEKDDDACEPKSDDVSIAETGSVYTDSPSVVLASDSESVASSKVTAESSDASESDSVAGANSKVSPLDFKETENYQSMSALRQIGLLYWKRFTVQKRDIKGAFFAIIVPVILVGLVILVLNVNLMVAGPPRELSPALYDYSYSSAATGDANTQILVGGGASARDLPDIQSEFIFMDAGLSHEYPHSRITHLEETRSSSELSQYLLDTYNDHDHPVRFGAFSIDDSVQLNININFTAFDEQLAYYNNSLSSGYARVREQRVDLLEVMGVAGRNGRLYWRKSAAEFANEFYSMTGVDPNIKVSTEGLHNLTRAALDMIMRSSNKDLVETRTEYEEGIRSFIDNLYNETLKFLKSPRFREMQRNTSLIVSDYMDDLSYVFNESSKIESDIGDIIQNFVKTAFKKLPMENVRDQLRQGYRWEGDLDKLSRDLVHDLSTLGEDSETGAPSIYNVTMKFVGNVEKLANVAVEEVTRSNYTVESIENALVDIFHRNSDDEFDRDVILGAISTMVNGLSELYDLGEADSAETVRSAVKWAEDRLRDYSDGSIQKIPENAFVAPLIFADYIFGKWNMTTISPEEAFGYLSELLGGSRRKLNGFISIRAKDVVVDFAKLVIDVNNIYVTTGRGTFIEIDTEIPLSFTLEALKALAPDNASNLQFQFEVYSKTSLLHNSSSPHAVAAFHQAYMEHRFKKCIGDNSGSARLVSVNHPLPLTAKQSLEIKVMLSVLAGLFILIPFCYIPATFIVFLVRERVSKSKHLQLVSGVNMSAYWISAYLWDITLYLVLTMCILLVFLMYGSAAEVFVGSKDAFLCTFALILGYGISALPFSYLLSRMFDNSSTAQISVAGIGWLTGFVTVIAYVTMDALEKTQHIAAAMQPWFRLFPAYNLGEGLMSMSTSFWYREILGWDQHPLDWDIAGRSICYIYLLALPYFFLVLVLEYANDGGSGGLLGRALRAMQYMWTSMMLRWHGIRTSVDETDATQYSLLGDDVNSKLGDDEDVARERQHVLKNREELRQNAPVVLLNLWKIYPPSVGVIGSCLKNIRNFLSVLFCCCCRAGPVDENQEEKSYVPKQAVRGVTTSVKKGETYALLGANGAGKTTIMGMLTGDITSTHGNAYIAGHNATGGSNNGVSEARRNIGFCPQKDPLLDLMTGRETLTMFAKLRGIPTKEVDGVVQQLLDRLTLTPHADKVTKAYSGGNKRKLSLGLALIGDPKVLLIDESSSGLDPLAKRRMWDLIEEAARSRSVILTTHSMQEAEALCTRVAIMVKGQYVCLGSVQHLKSKYLDGYSVDMFCKSSASNAVVDAVETEVLYALPGCRVSERYGRFLRFEVSNVSCLGLGTCFRRLQEIKNNPDLHVENYSVSQCSLEHVFVKLVNQDCQNDDMENYSSFTKASF